MTPSEIAEHVDADSRTPPFPFSRDPKTEALTSSILHTASRYPGEFLWSNGLDQCTHKSATTIDPLLVADRFCTVLSLLEGIFFMP